MLGAETVVPDPVPDLAVPLAEGRELRVRLEGDRATLSLWWPAPPGRASSGSALAGPAEIRHVIAALREMLWRMERAESRAAP